MLLSTGVTAGPPLATDDPGVLNRGGWEFTFAVEGDKRDAAAIGKQAADELLANGAAELLQALVE